MFLFTLNECLEIIYQKSRSERISKYIHAANFYNTALVNGPLVCGYLKIFEVKFFLLNRALRYLF